MVKPKRNKPPVCELVDKGPENCIIHKASTSCSDKFVHISSLKDPDGRLTELNRIKLRRLNPDIKKLEWRMEDVCAQISDQVTEGIGYHLQCYKSFTRNSERLPQPPAPESVSRPGRRSSDEIVFTKDCILCNVLGKI